MVLGLKAAPGTEEFDLFVKEVTKEITVKAENIFINAKIGCENIISSVEVKLKG